MLHNPARFKPSPIEDDSEENDEELEFYDFNEPEPGSPPGTLIIDEDATIPNIFLIDYNADEALGIQLATPEECFPYLDSQSVSWVDVQGLGSEEVLKRLGKVFKLHELVLEDIVNIPQRPKVESFEEQELIILHMVTSREDGRGFYDEQVSLILGKNYILTVQEEPENDVFEPIRQRIHRNRGVIRSQKADYLAYCLIDAIVDGFFPVLEDYGERLEDLQDEVVENPTRQTLDKIHKIKRELLLLRRAIWPQRDAINSLIREESPLIDREVRVFLRDCYDHTVQVMDMVETYRELAANLMDIYLSSLSNSTNEIMRFLTVISTVFIPLTFVSGVYGMNFDTESPWNMPELKMPLGYPFFWLLIMSISGGLLFYFWKKGWLFSPK
ncbi:magnesium/cobalt transporter CorA [Pseudanabaena galeata UHCC 0370]|jgi:magnesium transporter|uniref:Magnesium transport protein CorA n=1 Tax=Pseudanabaena galeata UHCC 0370 TaxID=3110310 RepID=A0ABU5TEG9_9CYAN|nr:MULTISPECIES: magnesium/cobalt transporter CorA [Pseudanabaena]MEA5476664.1 magnesium/cobalt transporter CorA [Pseudanabaena galeata UHCC 0370]MEA5490213.1 magnesium/cobalt transporter CorA [Pseudanabaena sp. CCNP1317]WGS72452.1 magnesium/cobalt transporter CorA [Pseudanabaena galeata CCNP1313]